MAASFQNLGPIPGLFAFSPHHESFEDSADATQCLQCIEVAQDHLTGGTITADAKEHVYDHLSLRTDQSIEKQFARLLKVAAILLDK